MPGPLDLWRARVAAGTLADDPAQAEAAAQLQALARVLADMRDRRRRSPALGFLARGRAPKDAPRGLYLWGPAGRGKSMLMDLFLETARVTPKRRVHFHAFMQEVHAGIAAARADGADDPVRPVAEAVAAKARLLCFDEMEITDITDAMLVGRLFERLFALGTVVVTTSNRHPDDLYKGGWNRDLFLPFIALLKRHMAVHELAGPSDHRRDRVSGSGLWLAPGDGAALDGLWRSLGGGGADTPLTLAVHGRKVRIGRASGRALRAGFDELCARPHGPAEFLALAAAIDVLLLEDVPVLSHKRFNEARRLVMLVDALYEARVRLAVSAAAEPDALYVDGEGAFEFARTASRLEEMRSAEWWGGAGG